MHDPASRPPGAAPRKILFIQHGDYAEAWRRLAAGGKETYRDQNRSVAFVAGLARDGDQAVTLSFAEREGRDDLAPGLSAIAMRAEGFAAAAARIFDEIAPTHLVLRAPYHLALREAARRGIPTLPSFADIFSGGGLRAAFRNRRLRGLLSGPNVPCVSNHSLNASRSVAEALGIPAARIVPWDWSRLPVNPDPKPGPARDGALTLFFAGAIVEDKGVGDALEALARLRGAGLDARMRFAGGGDLEAWRGRAAALGLGEAATFAGLTPNAQVRAEMRGHDVVLVPSRHAYPEGLPNTIYEALAARTPLLLSDHPAFAGRLRPEEDCLVAPQARPEAMAAALRRLAADRGLYARLSRNAGAALDGLYVGMEWQDLVSRFLDDPADRTGWVGRHSLETILRAG